MSNPSRTCHHCRWFATYDRTCRYYPPKVVTIGISEGQSVSGFARTFDLMQNTQWPFVNSTDWCGHHSEIPAEERVADALSKA